MTPNKLVHMANQIGSYFATDPQPDQARRQIAEHIKKFWAPSMRITLVSTLNQGPGIDAQLNEMVKQAVIEHREFLLSSSSSL